MGRSTRKRQQKRKERSGGQRSCRPATKHELLARHVPAVAIVDAAATVIATTTVVLATDVTAVLTTHVAAATVPTVEPRCLLTHGRRSHGSAPTPDGRLTSNAWPANDDAAADGYEPTHDGNACSLAARVQDATPYVRSDEG